jgi:mono/diheme cytochrome c family protein
MKLALGSCALALGVLALAGCGTARRGEPLTGRAIASETGMQPGARLFFVHCHKCHTGGESGLGPALNDKPFPAFLMKFQVRHGLRAMPAFGDEEISDEQLDELLAYVKSLRRP